MTTRRTFLGALAAISPAIAATGARAAGTDPSRQALVIGNSAYGAAPLANPDNDAKAIAALLERAGFTVESRLNAGRSDMIAALERFGATVNQPRTKLAVFYYAGHGAQLDWRNYLVPVDASVQAPEHIRERCVELGVLLGQLRPAKEKTYIIILDACRDDPFGVGFSPHQRGLSQFDAPAGSLLAYATAPGRVASDGRGGNGLYTESLVRELSVRNVRIEDALKRVRLNVRLQSGGRQTPWETTSLLNDVYLFSEVPEKPSDTELEKAFEDEIQEWNRVRGSRQADDWVAYLRRHPSGRFSEIAQVRLNRLLALDDRPTPPASARNEAIPAKTAPAVAPATPIPAPPFSVEFGPGAPAPLLARRSGNPYSAGNYPLGRRFTVGDSATFRESDLLTGVELRTYTLRVTRVDPDADRVEFNRGRWIVDLMGNLLKRGPVVHDVPTQFIPAELQVGRKWRAAFLRTADGRTTSTAYDLKVAARETVSVPAGEFDAFRIDADGWNMTNGNRIEGREWVVPGLNFPVRTEWLVRKQNGQLAVTQRDELVALRQHSAVAG